MRWIWPSAHLLLFGKRSESYIFVCSSPHAVCLFPRPRYVNGPAQELKVGLNTKQDGRLKSTNK